MPHITIVLASVREGRKSERVARYFERELRNAGTETVSLLDLLALDLPIFHERLKHQKEPLPAALALREEINKANGIIIVTPEYNGGYPAALKNAIDLLYAEWHRKPVAIATVSDGSFGGTQVIMSLQFVLWKMHAWTVPVHFPVPKVGDAFADDGTPVDQGAWSRRTATFLTELRWCMEARKRMEE